MLTLARLVLLAAVACSSEPQSLPAPPAELGALPADQATARPFDQAHSLWSGILQRYVRGDRFAYGELAREPEALQRYLDELHRISPEMLATWSREQQFAFWINAYNAHAVAKVVENYPLESIRKLDKSLGLNNVFEQAWIPMEAHHPEKKGTQLSLDDIEHRILRARFPDARIHAAVNCASVSCPPLLNEAYVAERLGAQLESQMRAFVNDPVRNRFDRERKVLALSEVFKWFEEDFVRDAGGVREYLLRFAPDEMADVVREGKLQYLDYSWDLNDAREKG